MKEIIFEGPLNSLSFGNVSINLLRELYKKKISVSLFPIGGNIDVSVFDKTNPEFREWLQYSYATRHESIKPETPTLKMWHLNGAEMRVGSRQLLYTFYELDSPTIAEKNIARLQDHISFSSSCAAEKFERAGLTNVSSTPLGFDPDFHKTGKEYLKDKIHFGLMGKWEKRKHTCQILKAWISKYGNNYDYQLSCCISNPFFKQDQMNQVVGQCLEGKQYGNVNFLPFLKTNSEVNDYTNSIDIDLSGLSGAEGWNLPAFNATSLGKWSIVLNATSHTDWATATNSILLEPTGKESAEDKIFFKKDAPFNQGNIHTFDEESLIDAMERAEEKSKTENTEGLKLQTEFTYEKTLNGLLSKFKV